MYKIISITIVIIALLTTVCKAQVSISNNASDTPDNSALMDVKSTDQGLLIPRLTSLLRTNMSSPTESTLVFDTDTDGFWYYNENNRWVEIQTSSPSVSSISNDAQSTIIDVEQNTDEDIIRFTQDGVEKLQLNQGGRIQLMNTGNSVVWGHKVGVSDDFNNHKNTFIGYQAGWQNTGSTNVALGYDVLKTDGSAANNVAIGLLTLQTNTSYHNIAIGDQAARYNTIGYNNISIGTAAGFTNQEGNENVLIGIQAGTGVNLHNKSKNVMIGFLAGDEVEGNSNVLLGNNIKPNDHSDVLSIDNSSSGHLIYGEFDNNKLKINGKLAIGNNGTEITQVIKSTVSISFPSINKNDHVDFVKTVTGAKIGSTVILSPSSPFPGALFIGQVRGSGNNQIKIKMMNEGGSNQSAFTRTFYVTIIN